MFAALASATANAAPSSVAAAGGLVAKSKKRHTLSSARPTEEATFGAIKFAPTSEPTDIHAQPNFASAPSSLTGYPTDSWPS